MVPNKHATLLFGFLEKIQQFTLIRDNITVKSSLFISQKKSSLHAYSELTLIRDLRVTLAKKRGKDSGVHCTIFYHFIQFKKPNEKMAFYKN